MSLAAALEQKSEHPLARAVLQKAQEDNLPPAEVADFQALPGNGLTAVLNGSTLYGGNAKLMQTLGVAVPQKMASSAEASGRPGQDPAVLCQGWHHAGRYRGGGRHQGGQPAGCA